MLIFIKKLCFQRGQPPTIHNQILWLVMWRENVNAYLTGYVIDSFNKCLLTNEYMPTILGAENTLRIKIFDS